MLGTTFGKGNEANAILKALDKSLAIIEFDITGTVLTANENFCKTLGYLLSEIQGRHHRIFCEPNYVASAEYAAFWNKLGRGEFDAREYKRIGKGGKEVWIQASYNPVLNSSGKVIKVVKVATDISGRVTSIHAVGEGLRELAENNLEYRLDQSMDPAFETLRNDFNESIDRLAHTMGEVSMSASSIDSNLGEIAAASDDLSRRTEQQAAAVEQTTAAVNEIASTVKASAERSRVATTAATTAKQEALQSSEVMSDAVSAMGNIERSSDKITQIIGVIDEIAFQTNLLALNAGVEAARAGDAGRGFAVVAQEVRALAQRSAEAAKEIKSIIASSSEQVKRGVNLVAMTGKALDKIVARVTEIDKLVAEISRASEQQAAGLGEVATAVNQMDEMTQRNAAMVEQSTAAVASCRNESAGLANTVSKFRVGLMEIRTIPAKRSFETIPKQGLAGGPVGRVQAQLATALMVGGAQPKEAEWQEF